MSNPKSIMLGTAGGLISLLLLGMGALMLVLLTNLQGAVDDLRSDVKKIGAIEARVTNVERVVYARTRPIGP